MKYLSNINKIYNRWNRFGIEHAVSDIFLCHFLSCGQQLKITKLPTREILNPREKNLNPQNTHEKNFWTHEIPTRKTFGPTKYPREKIWEPRNIHEKILSNHEIPTKAQWHDGTRPTKLSILGCIYKADVITDRNQILNI